MELSPFAQMPSTPDPVIARLKREATSDARLRDRAPVAEVERAVESAVRDLWQRSRVKVFVPVLALREVREAFGSQAAPPTPTADAPRTAPRRRHRDALLVDDRDTLLLDNRDALTIDDDGTTA